MSPFPLQNTEVYFKCFFLHSFLSYELVNEKKIDVNVLSNIKNARKSYSVIE